ncbi:MAG: alpha/beta hydrolase [Acidobacteriota bacterium]
MRAPTVGSWLPRFGFAALAAGILLTCSGCSAFERLGMRVLFDPTPWPAAKILEDVAYRSGDDAHPEKHRLDFFVPVAEGAAPWPTLVFVHGGSWRWGDKDLEVGGQDVYGNIGRFYASKGLGVAVISYRLQPDVNWQDQVDDVAAAVRRAVELAEEHGGDPDSIFLAGHSAGGQLASFTAVADGPLSTEDRARICGVVAISGAGFDPGDPQTYSLGADPEFYKETFRIDGADAEWARRASTLAQLKAARSPPAFLVFYAEKESKALHRQAELLHTAAAEAGLPSRLVEVPRLGHRRIIVEFSQEDSVMPGPVLEFVAEHRGCSSAS